MKWELVDGRYRFDLHDWLLTGIQNHPEYACDLRFVDPVTGVEAILRMQGVWKLCVYDFLAGNIVQTVGSIRVGDCDKAEVFANFRDAARDGYFGASVEDFFRGASDDMIYVEIEPTYGAFLCAIVKSVTLEKSSTG